MNKKIKRYMDEIQKTEKKIADLQEYLKGVKNSLKEEENLEMIRTIRGMKLEGPELFKFLDGLQSGKISFSSREIERSDASPFTQNEKMIESEENNHENSEKTE